ncbi:unnamed protein product [Calypogeia fissa]
MIEKGEAKGRLDWSKNVGANRLWGVERTERTRDSQNFLRRGPKSVSGGVLAPNWTFPISQCAALFHAKATPDPQVPHRILGKQHCAPGPEGGPPLTFEPEENNLET